MGENNLLFRNVFYHISTLKKTSAVGRIDIPALVSDYRGCERLLAYVASLDHQLESGLQILDRLGRIVEGHPSLNMYLILYTYTYIYIYIHIYIYICRETERVYLCYLVLVSYLKSMCNWDIPRDALSNYYDPKTWTIVIKRLHSKNSPWKVAHTHTPTHARTRLNCVYTPFGIVNGTIFCLYCLAIRCLLPGKVAK